MKKIILFFLYLLSVFSVFSATITVTSGADAGEGTLREAVEKANDGDIIVFADNITSVTFFNNGGLTIDKDLIINGNKNNNTEIIVQTGNTYIYFRHFTIEENTTVALNNLTLKNGNNMMTCGGSIYNDGNLSINNCSFINNRAQQSGAIHSATSNASLTITNSLFEENYATNLGGAISTVVKAQINSCYFKNNSSDKGGAIYSGANDSPNERELNITNCIFTNNIANEGAAISNNGKCTITNCLISGNQDNFGAIYNYGFYFAGHTATLTIINSTIANNKTGLYVNNNSFTITSLHNNIFYGNTSNDIFTINSEGIAISSNNLIGIDPLFVGNGDYSLQEGSPAIDAGNNSYLPTEFTTDLAGNPRISNNKIDIGAYEFQQSNTAVNDITGDTFTLSTQSLNIIIEDTNAAVSVYNISGQQVASRSGISSALKREIPVPAAGVYIVRVGAAVRKVIVP